MSDRLQELLWKRQDGELTAEEGRWLEERLARDPGARTEAERTAELREMLDAWPEEEPPVDLRARIDSALARSSVRHARRDSGPGLLAALFGPPASLRWAYLAAGLLIGAVGYHAVQTLTGPWTAQDLEEVYGVMVRPAAPESAAFAVPLAAEAGRLGLWREGASLLLEATLTGPEPAELVIEGAGVRLGGLSHDPAAPIDVRHADGALRIGGLASGRLALVARLEDPSQRVAIGVARGGRSLGRAEVELEALPQLPAGATNFFLRWE